MYRSYKILHIYFSTKRWDLNRELVQTLYEYFRYFMHFPISCAFYTYLKISLIINAIKIRHESPINNGHFPRESRTTIGRSESRTINFTSIAGFVPFLSIRAERSPIRDRKGTRGRAQETREEDLLKHLVERDHQTKRIYFFPHVTSSF